jgi:hypothetical protein
VSVYWRIDVTPVDSENNWDEDNSFSLTNIRQPLLTMRTGDDRDTFEFKMNNVRDKYLSLFHPRDRIIIRRARTKVGLDDDQNILMVGVLTTIPVTKNSDNDEIVLSGYNFTELVAQALVFADIQGLPINQALQLALESINTYTDNYSPTNRFVVGWDNTNPTLNTDGQPYPLVNEFIKNKPFRYIISKYSTSVETKTVRHYYHTNKENKLVWKPMTDDIPEGEDYRFGDNSKFLSLKKDIDTDGIVNFCILKGGLDIYDKQIMHRVIDSASTTKYGQKFLFVSTLTGLSQELIDRDMKHLGITDGKQPFPTASAPYTVQWFSVVTGTRPEVSNNEQYNKALRDHIKALLENEGRRVLEGREFGVFQLQLEFRPGTKPWFLGDLVQFSMENLVEQGLGLEKDLRVVECSYSHTSDTFTLAEDIGTV